MIWLSLACECGGPGPDSNPEPWELPVTGVGDSMMLSAWTHGEEMLVVGGGFGDDAHGDLFRYSDGTLCVEHAVTEHTLWWIHGDGTQWWAVGEEGTVLHSSGERRDIDTELTLYGVHVDEAGTVWVVGGDVSEDLGGVWSWNGADWDTRLETSGVIFKTWDGLFVGDSQTWVLDGEDLVDIGTEHRLVTIRDTTAVGGTGSSLVVEWDGAGWEEQDTLYLNGPLNGLYEYDGALFVGGNAGTMGYRSTEGWVIPDFPLTSDTFHAVWEHEGVVWFLGGNFFSAGDNHATMAAYGDAPSVETEECAR
ncbi:MAG TPA: hypothetical protein QGF58_29945 [Myxococcota bacterium]|nr:hypothetical protein [Myxococcota bacterium]